MGIEYEHYFIPEDPTHQCTVQQILDLIDYLKSEGLSNQHPDIRKVEDAMFNETSSVSEKEDLIISLADSVHSKDIPRIFGPSRYEDIGDEWRYIDNLYIHNGPSYNVHSWHESPLHVDTKESKTIWVETNSSDNLFAYQEFLLPGAELSKIKIEGSLLEHQANFKGYWRFAMCVDFGKDIPVFATNQLCTNAKFCAKLDAIVGCTLIQIGSYY